MRKPETLTRQERQVMEILFAINGGTVSDVRARLPDAPSYSSVRATLARLVAKGELDYSEQGPRYVYTPAVDVAKARKSALRKLVDTFFGGSSLKTMSALLDEASTKLTAEELAELETQVAAAKRRGSGKR